MANSSHQHNNQLWFCILAFILFCFIHISHAQRHVEAKVEKQQQQQQQHHNHGEDDPRHPNIIQKAIQGQVNLEAEAIVDSQHVIPPRSFKDDTDRRGKTVRKDHGGSNVSRPTDPKGTRIPKEPIVNSATALATIRPSASPAAQRIIQKRSFPVDKGGGSIYGRSLMDWELENIAIFITVNGSIIAKDRKDGSKKWNLETEPLIQAIRHKPRNPQALFPDPEDNMEWVVEGRDGGQLYRLSPNEGLQKLEVSVKQLVDNFSPYDKGGYIYQGAKKTVLYRIDPTSGVIVFDSDNPGAKDLSCRKKDMLDGLDDECRSSQSFTVGRTTYTIKIMNQHELLWTIIYTEWGPATQDFDLASQYKTSMDNKYYLSRYDGLVIGFDTSGGNRKPLFNFKFDSPVVSVFDVIRPSSTYNSDEQLVLLPQPKDPNFISPQQGKAHLNHIGGSGYFVMSETHYPGVTGGAPAAEISVEHWEDLDDEKRSRSFVGVHELRTNDRNLMFQPLGLEAQAETPDQIPTRSDPPPAATAGGEISPDPTDRLPYGRAMDAGVAMPWLLIVIYILYRYTPLAHYLSRKLKFRQGIPPLAIKDIKEDVTSVVPENIVEPVAEEKEAQPEPTEGDGVATPKKPRVKFEEPADGDETPTPAPKKARAHRGKRGRGSKNKARAEKAAAKKAGQGSGGGEDSSEHDEHSGGHIAAVLPAPQPLDHPTPKGVVAGDLVVSDEIIGHGSHGTVVYKGSFEGRDVAVKRMLVEFFDVASHEVTLLQESDDHPNVIRYYCKQQKSGFLYIALELCPASLQDVIDRPSSFEHIISHMDPQDVLYQMTLGIQYLHSLKIVHRDLKPQNILVTLPKKNKKDQKVMPPRILISDFGLCKKLDADQSSFRATTAHAAGTSGWRAPELLVSEGDAPLSTSVDSSTNGSTSDSTVVDTLTNRRATRAIDIFSLGCVFYFILTKGSHPFGDRYEREFNIVKGAYNLELLGGMGDASGLEARDLIESMLRRNPRERPDATTVLMHPFFWSDEKKLNFLLETSDRFESEQRDPPSPLLQFLESHATAVFGKSWFEPFEKAFINDLGTRRKYNDKNMLDLLRAFRNKKHHYQDLPDNVLALVGDLPGGYLRYFTTKFPKLFLHAYYTVRDSQLRDESAFKNYFTPPQ